MFGANHRRTFSPLHCEISCLLEVEAGMLMLNGWQSYFNSFRKQFGENRKLLGKPSVVLKYKLLRPMFELEVLKKSLEMLNGNDWLIVLEVETTDFVVDEAGNCFHFHQIRVVNSHRPFS